MTDENSDGRGPLDNKNPEENEFSDVFDQASGLEGTAGVGSELENKEEIIEKKEELVEKKEEVAEKKEEKKEEKKKDDEETFQQRYKTLQGIHKHDKEAWEAKEALLLKQIAEKEVKKEAENLSKEMSDVDLTPEEKAQLAEYEQDFDVVSKMEGLKRKKELAALRKEVEAWKKEVLDQLKPTQELLKETKEHNEIRSREDHFNAIRGAHPDFETHRDSGAIKKWIETKPKYLQEALMKTYQGGSTEEVIEFLHDFKTENNIKPDTDSKVVDINKKKLEKKEAMEAVVTRRGAVHTGGAVSTDFDGAFDEAANK